MQVWNGCTQLAVNTGCKKLPSRHHRALFSGHIFAIKARIDNRKKLVKQQYLLHMSGLLPAEICWRVWGTRANFNGFRVLAALLHGTLLVGISQSLRCWTESATYIRQGAPHVGHWPTFLVWYMMHVAYYADIRWHVMSNKQDREWVTFKLKKQN